MRMPDKSEKPANNSRHRLSTILLVPVTLLVLWLNVANILNAYNTDTAVGGIMIIAILLIVILLFGLIVTDQPMVAKYIKDNKKSHFDQALAWIVMLTILIISGAMYCFK